MCCFAHQTIALPGILPVPPAVPSGLRIICQATSVPVPTVTAPLIDVVSG
jgi:hypothetical protein